MKKIKYSSQFKRDIKRYAHNKEKMKCLYYVVSMLEREERIPGEYSPHMLKGEYKGCWECHIEGDFLLIWIDGSIGIIWLERLGSHSELFGKKK